MKPIIGSLEHYIILIITVFLSVLSIWIAKSVQKKETVNRIGSGIAAVLVLNALVYVLYRIGKGYWDLRYDLPMEFCDWAMIATTLALITRKRTVSELSYFWVLGGSIQAAITPNLQFNFPHAYFFLFFIGHSGLIIAALYLVFGLKLYPRKGSIGRVFLYSQIYFIVALLLDFRLDTNYGFLRYKPANGSFLDYLGEWPFYLLSLQILGIGVILLLYFPFYIRRTNRDAIRKKIVHGFGFLNAGSPRIR
ncbi:TIGR02206 family protein [Leptospira inadai serovar Lyme str. 10]|uniref:TIGR02206 family protein n=2 Tax=Leptospira inadai serovar Lyme TaxID=293084 RepID=V6HH80_9LEPT|nr:TIGR02206 family membrane protein [Leptospira inadai]EQA35585.1 TIGR02206 family protein [Leptospira inadai serovar Lyme str. 10]PNV73653.1 TIGR02206 family membrane protein [Leptospira inadai serovar Lyme]